MPWNATLTESDAAAPSNAQTWHETPNASTETVSIVDTNLRKQQQADRITSFLSLMTDAPFKCRFAGALAIAYRPLTTLFCAGVGTRSRYTLAFSVQILTAGSLVRALQHGPVTERLFASDQGLDQEFQTHE